MGKVGVSTITGSGSSLMDVSTERGVCEDEDIKINKDSKESDQNAKHVVICTNQTKIVISYD